MQQFLIGYNKILSFINNEPHNIKEEYSPDKDSAHLINCSQEYLSQTQKTKKNKGNKKCSCDSRRYNNTNKVVGIYEKTADSIICQKCLTDLSNLTSKENFVRNWIGDLDGLKSKLRADRQCIKGERFKQFESKGVIWYLVENNLIYRARLLQTWRDMREEGYLRHRSPQSLYSHAMHLVRYIKSLKLPDDICDQFKKVAETPLYTRRFIF